MQLTRSARISAKRAAAALVRGLAARPITRRKLNAFYNRLSVPRKAAFHRWFSEIFLEHDTRLAPGEWAISFMGEHIRLPLRPEQARLDWVAAVSILGHESEIKSTYEFLLAANPPIDVFLDVGANYGTHSILFASRGIETIAFEPNRKCLPYCEAVCALNRFEIRWESVALGDRDGKLDLVFPDGQTWLGSLVQDVADRLVEQHTHIVVEPVELTTLDRYADNLRARRVLLKIDVEGGELAVLRGAVRILQQTRPTIVFETNDAATRIDLVALLREHRYRIFDLPFLGEHAAAPLTNAAFQTSPATNFIALPYG